MGFLDNLESSLKTLESGQERDPAAAERNKSRKELDKKRALAAAPYAEALKKSAFTMDLLTHATLIGHGQRTKIDMTWIGNTLRLRARDRRLELEPTPEGVLAVFYEGEQQTASELIDLAGNPEQLAARWLQSVP